MSTRPAGEERKVQFLGGASIDGAPIAYIVVLAAVVTALAFIPLSVIMASGGSFPLSQGIWSLMGWILGPIAGAVAGGIGTLIGIFLAPHTAGVAPVSILGAVLAAFAAGSMVTGGKRKSWWIPVFIIGLAGWLLYTGRGFLVNGVGLQWVILQTASNWISLLLFALPTRTLIAKWIASKNIGLVALGVFVGTWVTFGTAHIVQSSITYIMFNWPEEVWILLTGLVPFEFLQRCVVGTVIGTGVIAGMRAIGLVKPEHATY